MIRLNASEFTRFLDDISYSVITTGNVQVGSTFNINLLFAHLYMCCVSFSLPSPQSLLNVGYSECILCEQSSRVCTNNVVDTELKPSKFTHDDAGNYLINEGSSDA